MRTALVPLAALAFLAAMAAAAGGPSAARGKELFESPALGTNGKTCAACHAGGKRLDEVNESDDEDVAGYANTCIEGMLAGKKLPAASDDLRSLVMHLRAIAPKGM
jgi:cytochrome c553